MTPTARFRYRLRHRPIRLDRAKAEDGRIWERGLDESNLQFRTRVTDDCLAKGLQRVTFFSSGQR